MIPGILINLGFFWGGARGVISFGGHEESASHPFEVLPRRVQVFFVIVGFSPVWVDFRWSIRVIIRTVPVLILASRMAVL